MNDFTAFHRVLDPADNATGGGAASAIAGSMGAGLVGMVARLSIGRKNMLESDDYYEKINQDAITLSERLVDGSNADSAAFDQVMKAYRLARQTEEEKQARAAAIQAATILATEVPLKNAEHCARVLDLAAMLVGKSNQNAASDLDCARFLAAAGLQGALSNAEINIDGIIDEALAAQFRSRVLGLKKRV